MRVFPTLNWSSPEGAKIGQHALWNAKDGVKVPFQWDGRLTKWSCREQTYDLTSLQHEVTILRALAAQQMAPPVGEWVYYQQVESTYPGAWWCDPCGAFGYRLGNADVMRPGSFDLAAMKRLPIEGSPGAWNDIMVPERGNVRNGYLVDVRRSVFDMLCWTQAHTLAILPPRPKVSLDLGLATFPKGERPDPYQEFYLDGRWVPGSRQVVVRAEAMGFDVLPGESVVDVGCHVGGFLQHAQVREDKAGALIGVDVDPDYVAVGRALCARNQHNICLRHLNVVTQTEEFFAWIKTLVGKPDHLLLLSLWKHIGSEVLWKLVDSLEARHTYIESQPTKDGTTPLDADVAARGGKRVGESADRNRRILFRLDR